MKGQHENAGIQTDPNRGSRVNKACSNPQRGQDSSPQRPECCLCWEALVA